MRHARRSLACLAGSILVALAACGGGRASSTHGATGGGATSVGPAGTGGAGGATTASATAGTGAGPTCAPADVIAAPDGQGDACSCAAPCALTTARDHARALAPAAQADVVVLLLGGAYRLDAPFDLGAVDSGQNGHAVVYRASPSQTPVLSGAVQAAGFAGARGPNGSFVGTVPPGTHARAVWIDGRRAVRARGADAPPGFGKTASGFALGDASMATWPDRAGIELVGTNQWKMFRCPASDVSAGGITVAAPCWAGAQAQAGYTFDAIGWIENALELLDEPGEAYLDDDAGKLYYLPRAGEDVLHADVEVPRLEQLVRATGTPGAPIHDVAFEGITFSHTTWRQPSSADGYASLQAGITPHGSPVVMGKPMAAVTVHAGERVRFTGCTFSHLGATALALEVAAHQNVVERSRFDDVSGSAVIVGDVTHDEDHHPPDPSLAVADNTVDGCLIRRAGVELHDTPAIFVGYTTHTTVKANEIFDVPYTGISVGWGWGSVDVGGSLGYATPSTSHDNDVRANLVSHTMRKLRDGGGVYVLGAQAGSQIAGNVIEEQGNPYGNLYLDNGTQHFAVTGNVVFVDLAEGLGAGDPNRSYWLYVQVFAPIALHNTVTGNFTNDATPYAPMPVDPSNVVDAPTLLGGGPSPADAIVAAAGSALRSPNVAVGKPSSASSEYDAAHTAGLANNRNAFDGWSPTGADMSPWWQVDLGEVYVVDSVEVVSRWALDQPVTRRSYRVVGSTDPGFATKVTLGEVDATGLPHRAIFGADVVPPASVRYVRVEKTAPEYFFLGEVRVHGHL